MLSVLWNVLTLALWPRTQSILENLPWVFKKSFSPVVKLRLSTSQGKLFYSVIQISFVLTFGFLVVSINEKSVLKSPIKIKCFFPPFHSITFCIKKLEGMLSVKQKFKIVCLPIGLMYYRLEMCPFVSSNSFMKSTLSIFSDTASIHFA